MGQFLVSMICFSKIIDKKFKRFKNLIQRRIEISRFTGTVEKNFFSFVSNYICWLFFEMYFLLFLSFSLLFLLPLKYMGRKKSKKEVRYSCTYTLYSYFVLEFFYFILALWYSFIEPRSVYLEFLFISLEHLSLFCYNDLW